MTDEQIDQIAGKLFLGIFMSANPDESFVKVCRMLVNGLNKEHCIQLQEELTKHNTSTAKKISALVGERIKELDMSTG